MRHSRAIFPFLLMLLIGMSLACSFSFSTGDPTPTLTPTAAPPTDTPIPPPPTLPPATPTTVPAPIETQPPQTGVLNPNAVNSGDVYYSETFDNLDNWTSFLVKGEEANVSFEVINNRLHNEINAQDTYLYHLFEGGVFTDVRVDVQVENRASNTNFVGIICRYTENGWYEANILNTGEYFIYYSSRDANGTNYSTMYEGLSQYILTGQKMNDYSVVCQGEQMSIYINGNEAVTIPLKSSDYLYLPEGKTGLSISTSDIIPVVVDFLQFVLSVP